MEMRKIESKAKFDMLGQFIVIFFKTNIPDESSKF